MKKTLIMMACAVAILTTSCTTSFQAISTTSYRETNAIIEEQLSDFGFQLSGQSDETKNEVSVNRTSYSRYTGYGSEMKNNYFQYHEYSFTDSADNSVSYTVKYQLKRDMDGKEYIENLELTNCSANKKYNTICGNDGIVKGNIQKMTNNPDITVTETNSSALIYGITLGALGISTVVLIIALLL